MKCSSATRGLPPKSIFTGHSPQERSQYTTREDSPYYQLKRELSVLTPFLQQFPVHHTLAPHAPKLHVKWLSSGSGDEDTE